MTDSFKNKLIGLCYFLPIVIPLLLLQFPVWMYGFPIVPGTTNIFYGVIIIIEIVLAIGVIIIVTITGVIWLIEHGLRKITSQPTTLKEDIVEMVNNKMREIAFKDQGES